MPTYTDKRLEKLTTTIQNYLNNNTALLIGSGSSIPYGLPSMLDLSDEIKTKLHEQYKNKLQWKTFITELESSKNLEITLDKIEINDKIHSDIILTVWKLILKKDGEALENILKNNKMLTLSKILKKFVEKTDPTNIITTNYDRLIEYAIDFSEGKLSTGFTGHYIKRFTRFNEKASKRQVNVFKVHGSIDWFQHIKNKNIISTSAFNNYKLEDKYKPLIVTPGNNKFKETHYDPFRTIISKADEALRSSQAYLCIGYGFNDEHIQPIIIDENRNHNKPIVIITKNITKRIDELFLNDATNNCLILTEGDERNGSKVFYSSSDSEDFLEKYWQLDEFYKLWF